MSETEIIERPLVGMVELLEDPPGAAEDLADRLAGPGEIDAGGVDHRRQRVAASGTRVDRRRTRRSARSRGTEPVAPAGDGDRRALLGSARP